jgi:hypothetical protein
MLEKGWGSIVAGLKLVVTGVDYHQKTLTSASIPMLIAMSSASLQIGSSGYVRAAGHRCPRLSSSVCPDSTMHQDAWQIRPT